MLRVSTARVPGGGACPQKHVGTCSHCSEGGFPSSGAWRGKMMEPARAGDGASRVACVLRVAGTCAGCHASVHGVLPWAQQRGGVDWGLRGRSCAAGRRGGCRGCVFGAKMDGALRSRRSNASGGNVSLAGFVCGGDPLPPPRQVNALIRGWRCRGGGFEEGLWAWKVSFCSASPRRKNGTRNDGAPDSLVSPERGV